MKFSAQAAILKILLDVVSPGSLWAKNLYELINSSAQIDVVKMGFGKQWHKDEFWTQAKIIS